MSQNTVLILGDSTSMTLGMEGRMYPYLAAAEPRWPSGTRILNPSLPGFTAADAAAFFFGPARRARLSAVVIYLGNCDAASTEIPKGRYTAARQAADRLREALGKKRPKTHLRNRLLHFEWNNAADASLEAPEEPGDFEFNLARILSACRERSVPAVLVRPMANRDFLPGVGKGNFLFYRYLGSKERIASRLAIPEGRFLEALRSQEEGRFPEAMQLYKEILLTPARNAMQPEYPLVIANNYAVAAAESGAFAEAEYLLGLLLKERGARKEILLYNLARVARLKGEAERFQTLLGASAEADRSLYRVRAPYLEAIDRLAGRFPGVRLVDLRDLLKPEDFLDHCHPLPPAQKRIASAVTEALPRDSTGGAETAVIENFLTNPELALGNQTEFFAYYRTYAPFSVEEIRGFRESLRERLRTSEEPAVLDAALEGLPAEFRTGVTYCRRHPVFPSMRDLLRSGPVYPSDIGRFPEFFLLRYLAPRLQAHERSPELRGRFAFGGVLRSSEELLRALPEPVRAWVEKEPGFDRAYEETRLPAILSRVRSELNGHLRSGGRIHERRKTTIFWYVRELLRFGAHSRHSMRYDRVTLENFAEALAVAGVLDLRLGARRAEEIRQLISVLEEAVSVHEEAARLYQAAPDDGEQSERYDARLTALAEQLELAEARN